MRIQPFQVSLVDKTRKNLPRALKKVEARSFFNIVKLHYGNPRLHYEVCVRGKERLVEVGLHFEADQETNDALLAYFNSHALEIHAELGGRVEIEQWTNSWSRVHEFVPYESLDAKLVDALAQKLGQMITVLQPMLVQFEKQKPRRTRKPARS